MSLSKIEYRSDGFFSAGVTAVDPRELVSEIHWVEQRTMQVAGWARKLARYVIESPGWQQMPEDARLEWLEREDRADKMFSDLGGGTT